MLYRRAPRSSSKTSLTKSALIANLSGQYQPPVSRDHHVLISSSVTSSLSSFLISLAASCSLCPFILYFASLSCFLLNNSPLSCVARSLNSSFPCFLDCLLNLCVSPGFVQSVCGRYCELWRLQTSQTSQLLLSSLTLPPWSAPTAKVPSETLKMYRHC